MKKQKNPEPLSPANHPGSNQVSAVAKLRDLLIYERKKVCAFVHSTLLMLQFLKHKMREARHKIAVE